MTGDFEFRFSGAYSELPAADKAFLLERGGLRGSAVSERVVAIIDRVRKAGDVALREMARELDGVNLDELEVARESLVEALDELPRDLRQSMERAADNIRRFHEAQLPQVSSIIIEPGVIVGRRPDPLGSVGVYAPGGRASYPSSVLMGAVPARVAGVGEIILCSPPSASGSPSRAVLAAARLAGVDRVFAVGGAGAIAAMCVGTTTIPRVDKVVGPGNAYVAEAKLQLATAASFDSPAGPSELLVIADDMANPGFVAREVLAQAEHDPEAIAVVVVTDMKIARLIETEILLQLKTASRKDIIATALAERGGVVTVGSIEDALDISNRFAPEHLLLAVVNPRQVFDLVRNAGTVFLGEASSVSFGDYMTGANHVLPTGGLARSYSGLSTLDFVRWTTFQEVTASAAASLAKDVAIFAEAEGLSAHAAASLAWAEVST
ncbi:MAG: histidinol dehydrogenase [Gemmatimonadaceae bacterium]